MRHVLAFVALSVAFCAKAADRAALFGVYEFLERHVGYRFCFRGDVGTVVPHVASLRVPVGSRVLKPDGLMV